MAIRVVLADDHTILRAGLKNLLQGFNDVELIAEADDGRDTVARTQELPINFAKHAQAGIIG